MIQKSYNDTATLFLIPTPIGNLDDITVRALNVLKMVDVILCEDTRNTGILLQNYNIHKKLVSCHEYNEENMIESVILMLSIRMTIEWAVSRPVRKGLWSGSGVDGMGCKAPRIRRCKCEGSPKHPQDVSRKASTVAGYGKVGRTRRAKAPNTSQKTY